jgi:DNA-binding MarR family transcriptional regulator
MRFYHGEMSCPLPTLLSRALVAFTIEADNEFEHRMPHQTTSHGGTRSGPWLVSMVMWWNCMRFVGAEGISVRKLEELARTKTNVHGMHRWGYVAVDDARGPRSQWLLRATPNGRRADETWRALLPEMESRWEQRLGAAAAEALRQALRAIASRLEPGLPDCMPILHHGLWSKPEKPPRKIAEVRAGAVPTLPGQAINTVPRSSLDKTRTSCIGGSGWNGTGVESNSLPALLSRILLAFAIDFESESNVSLAICANVLRLSGEEELRVQGLPRLAGISKEAVAMALGFLEKRGYAAVTAASPGARTKALVLTPKGRRAREEYQRLRADIEDRWGKRFSAAVTRLRNSLEQMESSLLACLKPYPDGWRASLPPIEVLPEFPMVLHRGGFPDGS